MKTLFALLLASTAAFSQVLPNSNRQAGEYFGVLLPTAAVCSTERLIIQITVGTDDTLTGEVVNWNNDAIFSFDAQWPFFNRGVFRSSVTPTLEDSARGTFSAATGSVSGVVNLRPSGGCLYTFKAYRRFKLN